jgi:hypothetical protein
MIQARAWVVVAIAKLFSTSKIIQRVALKQKKKKNKTLRLGLGSFWT